MLTAGLISLSCHIRQSLTRASTAIALYALSAGYPALASPTLPLMPMPRAVESQNGALRINGVLVSSATGCDSAIVPGAIARFGKDLAALTGTSLSGAKTALAIRCLAHDPKAQDLEAREGYRLTVSETGITVEADGETGVVRALATLRQLVSRDSQGPIIPSVRIDDAPRFPWRGLMIDTARHFVTVPTIKRQIDAMELAKLNVLHLHLSDNEAFRVESHRFPRLTSISSHGEYYTQAEIRDLVRYATERGVRIVPEFDMPGHSLALLTAYPELAVAPIDPNDPLIQSKGALNPASKKTYRFLKTLLGEMTALFPDRYFHVGGDEVSDAAWNGSAEVEAFKKKYGLTSKTEVEAWFHSRVRAILAAKGKSTIGWDEMANGPQPKELIIQSWRTSNPVSTATAKGHRVIVSAGYYMDHLRPADMLYAVDPLDPTAFTTMTAEVLAMVRRNPAKAAMVSDGLVAKPLPPLTPEQEKLVLGGEGPLWAEIVSDEMLDGRLWPRALALGERFWSPASLRDPDNMYERLLPAMDQLRALGLLDVALRDRMIARLAPDAPDVVARLVDLVAPARLFVHNHAPPVGPKREIQELIEPADAASTDGSPARRFRVNVSRYLGGDQSQGAELRADLTAWRENEAPFVKVAAGRPLLEAAIPTARDIAALGVLGLAALDAIEQGKPLSAEQSTEGQRLLKRLKDFEDASKDLLAAIMKKQPPAHLIVLVAPDVGRLFDAAEAKTKP